MAGKSVTVGGVSYNADHARALGKDEWVKAEKGHTPEIFDAIIKQADADAKLETEATAKQAGENKIQAEAQAKLDARGKGTAPAPAKGQTNDKA